MSFATKIRLILVTLTLASFLFGWFSHNGPAPTCRAEASSAHIEKNGPIVVNMPTFKPDPCTWRSR